MNAENIDQIYSNPIFLLLVGLVVLSILATFILPLFLKIGKLRFSTAYSFKKIGKHKAWSFVIAVLAVIIVGGAAFVFFASRPIVLTAEEFKNSESEALEELGSIKISEVSEKGDLYLIDTRYNSDFFNAHIAGSFNAPKENYDPGTIGSEKRVALYSSQDGFNDAYQMARSYKLNNLRNLFVKVYVVKDGFEGLSEAGLQMRGGSLAEEL